MSGLISTSALHIIIQSGVSEAAITNDDNANQPLIEPPLAISFLSLYLSLISLHNKINHIFFLFFSL